MIITKLLVKKNPSYMKQFINYFFVSKFLLIKQTIFEQYPNNISVKKRGYDGKI